MTISLYAQMDDASKELTQIEKEMRALKNSSFKFALTGLVVAGAIWFFFGFIAALVCFVIVECCFSGCILKPSKALNKKYDKAYENYNRISKRINRLED